MQDFWLLSSRFFFAMYMFHFMHHVFVRNIFFFNQKKGEKTELVGQSRIHLHGLLEENYYLKNIVPGRSFRLRRKQIHHHKFQKTDPSNSQRGSRITWNSKNLLRGLQMDNRMSFVKSSTTPLCWAISRNFVLLLKFKVSWHMRYQACSSANLSGTCNCSWVGPDGCSAKSFF